MPKSIEWSLRKVASQEDAENVSAWLESRLDEFIFSDVSEWKEVKKDDVDAITIWEKASPFFKGLNMYRSHVIVPWSASTVFSVVDVKGNHRSKWDAIIESYSIVKSFEKDIHIVYVTAAGWGGIFGARDFLDIAKFRLPEDPATFDEPRSDGRPVCRLMAMACDPEAQPNVNPGKKYTRACNFPCSLYITPIDKYSCKVDRITSTNPGGMIANRLVNHGVKTNMMETNKAMIAYLNATFPEQKKKS